ncbi:hypothetical protein MUK42_34357 [Musa troglodytarum]|uniref:Uncharacterized protein n=1 Tax=Musa troglodytarum TaxID=320322 RepID=A0A9E7GA62_9LILI|nr:hypothetical protein MUK42_34357 [Musa troglodytarum]
MSTCGNCDCADKSQCVKKGNSNAIESVATEKSYFDGVVDAPATAETEGDCMCGPSCACVDCQCGQ